MTYDEVPAVIDTPEFQAMYNDSDTPPVLHDWLKCGRNVAEKLF